MEREIFHRRQSAEHVIAPRRCAFGLHGLCALLIYFALAATFLARGIVHRFSTAYIGHSTDPPMLMWLMAWPLHAIRHGLNPLFTNAIWAPEGFNLAWSPLMLPLAPISMPLIDAAGPAFTYNFICVLAIASAAWCAFILCRYVTGAFWPALVGGYVFGFSAYMLAHVSAHVDVVLVFPIPLFVWLLIRAGRADISSRALLWQLESDWYFRMAGGYAGIPPLSFRRWPIVDVFYRDDVALPDAAEQLKAFLATHQADAVMVDDREAGIWRPLTTTLGIPAVQAGGITIYRVPAADLAPWKAASALQMEVRADRARFDALVLAADNYLRAGHDPAALTAAKVFESGLLPAEWTVVPKVAQSFWAGGRDLLRPDRDVRLFAGMQLTADHRGFIEVRLAGWYPALRSILNRYRSDAVSFSPRDLDDARSNRDDQRGRLTMTFDRDGLARVASQIREGQRASNLQL
jgi:hypothetical protein